MWNLIKIIQKFIYKTKKTHRFHNQSFTTGKTVGQREEGIRLMGITYTHYV